MPRIPSVCQLSKISPLLAGSIDEALLRYAYFCLFSGRFRLYLRNEYQPVAMVAAADERPLAGKAVPPSTAVACGPGVKDPAMIALG